LNRFHYGWHFFWDTSTTDVGNTGVHHLDVARWGMKKDTHPTRVHCAGGLYAWDSDQETPNVQTGTLQYEDGSLIDFEATNLYSPPSRSTNIFYSTDGYMAGPGGDFAAMRGTLTPRKKPDVMPSGVSERAANQSYARSSYTQVPIDPVDRPVSHFHNFIDCVRSRKVEDLYCDILEGHLSTTLAHLANISFRVGRSLKFNPKTERFDNDAEANAMLTRKYREPYVLPEKV
jgi:predicted dehydrogenase